MAKLTDTQLVVLSAAARRADGAIEPLPSNVRGRAAAKVVEGLIRRGLAERVPSGRAAVPDPVRITREGLAVIGVADGDEAPRKRQRTVKRAAAGRSKKKRSAPSNRKGRAPRADSKQATALALLRRAKGASAEELQTALGWQPHTVRGFIAGAVKKRLGLAVESEKVEGRGRVYRVVGNG